MKRSCQRHTQVFYLPVRRMISLVPTPSALNRTISARQTCLCGLLRSRASAFRRRRSAGLRVMEIPVRMRQTRMHSGPGESPPGFKCQTRSTSTIPIVSISGDPVGLGLAASLAHPQGNLTGFAILSVGVETKQLQILKDLNPNLARVAVLTNPTNAVNA